MTTLTTRLEEEEGKDGIALALCGGGYRAVLFHAGCLRRLNELGWLPRIRTVSSVSGGAISAGVLASSWDALDFDASGVARNLHEQFVTPIRGVASETIDEWCLLGAACSASSAATILADALDRYLFDGRTLQDLPEESPRVPRFIFSASNLESGALFSFCRSRIWDWRLGDIGDPRVRLAVVVAATAGSVPMLSPLVLSFADAAYEVSGASARRPSSDGTVVLTDGSVIDPLALDAIWDCAGTIVVCDGGGSVPDSISAADWFAPTARVLALMHERARRAQMARLSDAHESGISGSSPFRESVYCGIHGATGRACLEGETPPCSAFLPEAAPTRLSAMTVREQELWIDHGYAACEAATAKEASACGTS
jgi:NTE family protein